MYILLQIREELKEDIERYQPMGDMLTDEIQFPLVNVLLFGGVGAGKSSVFNTFNSVFRGKIFNVARSGCAEHSLTTKVKFIRWMELNFQPRHTRLGGIRKEI